MKYLADYSIADRPKDWAELRDHVRSVVVGLSAWQKKGPPSGPSGLTAGSSAAVTVVPTKGNSDGPVSTSLKPKSEPVEPVPASPTPKASESTSTSPLSGGGAASTAKPRGGDVGQYILAALRGKPPMSGQDVADLVVAVYPDKAVPEKTLRRRIQDCLPVLAKQGPLVRSGTTSASQWALASEVQVSEPARTPHSEGT